MSTELLRAIGWDLVTGRPSGLPDTIHRAIAALEAAGVRYAVTEAVALGLRTRPRATLDLDVVVSVDEVVCALATLREAGLRAPEPDPEDVDPQYVVTDPTTGVTVDVLVGFGEPELSLLAGATRLPLAGLEARVARAEHLLISYLYSDQPRHLGDFAALVQGGVVERAQVRRILAELHPEMLPTLEQRWEAAANPPPAPPRPPRRPRRG